MFKIGEYIIHKRDMCIIKGIEKSPINNKFKNLRYPLFKEEAESLINKISTIPPIKTNDKLLENIYRELVKTNKHEDIIKIIKTTYLRNETRINQGKK